MLKIYRCPGCRHALEYDGKRGLMICPQHAPDGVFQGVPQGDPAGNGTTISVQTVLLMESQGQNVTKSDERSDPDGSGNLRFFCPSCGAPLLPTNDEFTASLRCPSCNNPVEIESRMTGGYAPQWILPFKMNKGDAKEGFKKWAKKGKLTPSSFKQDSTLAEIQAYYVPTWLYSYTIDADLDLTGKRSKKEKQGDSEVVTEETFKVDIKTRGAYDRVPVNADETVERGAMEVLEPFDYNALTEFALPYLAGARSERYHFTPDKFTDEVKATLKDDLIQATKEKVTEYDEVTVDGEDVVFSDERIEYALLPVWMLIFRYRQKKYPLFMNGQTGKVYGKLPTSFGKVMALFGSVFAVILAILIILWRVFS